MAEFSVEDFSGGETDKWRNNNDPRFYKEAKNMYITEQRTLETRPGLGAVFDDQRPWDSTIVRKLWHHITRRDQVSGDNFTTRYQTFAVANEAVLVNSNISSPGVAVTAEGGVNRIRYLSTSQGNYVRLNDNEFVFIPDGRYPQKFYRILSNGQWKYTPLGLPQYNGNSFQAISDGTGSNSWTYAIVAKHEYEVFEPGSGFVTKIVRGAPTFSNTIINADIPTLNIPEIDGFWVDNEFSVVGSEAFAESEISVEVYRNTDSGSIFYKLTEIVQAGLPFVGFPDNTPDSTLQEREVLYTTGGVVPNQMTSDRPKFATYANDALWLFSGSRGWQSKVGIYDAVPGSFNFIIREGERITGCNTLDIFPIVGTRQGVYRIEGIVDDLGNGTHRVRTISEEHGCMSNKTMVRAKNKIFFWSDDGIYETNGYQAKKVSGSYDTRYLEIVNRVGNNGLIDAIFIADGAYDVDNERIMWIFPREDGDEYNRDYIVLHLSHPTEEGYAITSGGFEHYCTSISAANGSFFVSTVDGSVLKEDPLRFTDLPVSPALGSPVIRFDWNYVSCSLSFGTRKIAKWFTRLFLTFQAKGTALSAQVYEDTDESGTFRELNAIEEPVKSTGQYALKRWFKKGRIRGKYKQVMVSRSNSIASDQKVELIDLSIEFEGPGEGVTQSERA